MSSNSHNVTDNQEIDLSQISKKIGSFFESIAASIFKGILFIKRNILILAVLFIVGAGLGFYLDATSKVYDNEIIVSPNFGTTDYLYSKIDLLNSKISQQDSIFLKSIGLKEYKNISKIKVEPIIDIYSFVNNNTPTANNAQNTQNFELVKLLSEDGDINKVIKDGITSRNYSEHTITITTSGYANNKNFVAPILNYLNKNEYYLITQKTFIDNINIKMKEDEIVINQIDTLLNQFSATSGSSQKSDKLVYYNENSQLNDLISTKNSLISNLGYQRTLLIAYDKIIKDKSTVLNIKNNKGTTGKMKLILPFLLLFGFIFSSLFKSFYRKQSAKIQI